MFWPLLKHVILYWIFRALATAEEEVNGQDLEVVVEENVEDEILAILLMFYFIYFEFVFQFF